VKKTLILTAALLLLPIVALAGPLTLEWSPVAGAAGYDIMQSVDNGTTFAVLTSVLPAVCVGTPALCAATITTPTTGRPQYCVTAKNAGGSQASQICIVATDVVQPPKIIPSVPPPVAVDGAAGSR
jgi:hypothetical protein